MKAPRAARTMIGRSARSTYRLRKVGFLSAGTRVRNRVVQQRQQPVSGDAETDKHVYERRRRLEGGDHEDAEVDRGVLPDGEDRMAEKPPPGHMVENGDRLES